MMMMMMMMMMTMMMMTMIMMMMRRRSQKKKKEEEEEEGGDQCVTEGETKMKNHQMLAVVVVAEISSVAIRAEPFVRVVVLAKVVGS